VLNPDFIYIGVESGEQIRREEDRPQNKDEDLDGDVKIRPFGFHGMPPPWQDLYPFRPVLSREL
jgi:hypothetical protein